MSNQYALIIVKEIVKIQFIKSVYYISAIELNARHPVLSLYAR